MVCVTLGQINPWNPPSNFVLKKPVGSLICVS